MWSNDVPQGVGEDHSMGTRQSIKQKNKLQATYATKLLIFLTSSQASHNLDLITIMMVKHTSDWGKMDHLKKSTEV